jgi:hypothetical protein
VDVYIETGSKRAFATAIDWPGWSRAGRDEAAALDALFAYGPRYARVVGRSRLGFRAPNDAAELVVVERVKGNATTDFGAPGVQASVDARPIDEADVRRSTAILRAVWRAFDRAADAAEGRRLATGPRGGGRSLPAIRDHVSGAEDGYLRALAWKAPRDADAAGIRAAVLEAFTHAARHGVEERGPRGGKRWTPRYFVRRVAWHALDHAWELQDRTPA